MKFLITVALLTLTPPLRADEFAARFAVVMIDDKTEAKLGAFPYDRAVIARGVNRCAENGAKAVVLKFFFDHAKTATGDSALRDAMRKVPVALQARLWTTEGTMRSIPRKFGWAEGQLPTGVRGNVAWVPLDDLMDAAMAVGFVDFDRPDIPLVEDYRGLSYKSLIVCSIELALDTSARAASGKVYFGGRSLRVDDSNVFHANLSNTAVSVISFADLIEGRIEPRQIDGRVVIMGWDAARTPTIKTEVGAVRIHRYFVNCLAACYRELKDG